MPFFSIIIPVYNVAPYLRECLDSVLAQTFTDWEAICVDDGSADGSGAILDEYVAKDRRFRVVHQENAGPSAARNKGLDEAKGEWIWFVDSDDTIKPEALDTFASIELKADVTFFSMEQSYVDGFRKVTILKPCAITSLGDESSSEVLRLAKNSLGMDAFGWTWDKFIRKRLISENYVRFDERVNFFEDELFTLELFRHAKSFAVLSDVLYTYRVVNTGLTRSGEKAYLPIAEKFLVAAHAAIWQGMRELAFRRAYWFLQRSLHQKGFFRAAKAVASNAEDFCRYFEGRRIATIKRLSLFLPTSVVAMVVWLMQKV